MYRFDFGILFVVGVCLISHMIESVPSNAAIEGSHYIYPKASVLSIKNTRAFRVRRDPSYSSYQTNTVPAKRSTMLLNKLMHALHRALDSDVRDADRGPEKDTTPSIAAPNYPVDLQRRGEDKMTRYFRCYFNAVSCF